MPFRQRCKHSRRFVIATQHLFFTIKEFEFDDIQLQVYNKTLAINFSF